MVRLSLDQIDASVALAPSNTDTWSVLVGSQTIGRVIVQ